jgi:hypothetical protein
MQVREKSASSLASGSKLGRRHLVEIRQGCPPRRSYRSSDLGERTGSMDRGVAATNAALAKHPGKFDREPTLSGSGRPNCPVGIEEKRISSPTVPTSAAGTPLPSKQRFTPCCCPVILRELGAAGNATA